MANPMKASLSFVIQKLVPAAILLALGMLAFVLLVLSKKPSPTVEGVSALQKVTVSTTAHYEGPIFIEANGVVVPHKEIIMAAEVAGKIKSKNADCQSGHWVAEKTELMTIEPKDYEIAVSRLEAELKQADTQLYELAAEIQNADALLILARKNFELQQREYGRLERLRGSVSASEIDQAGINLNQSENALLTQQHQLTLLKTRQARLDAARELVELQLEKANLDLERTKIKAPSNGVIVVEEIEEGSYVQPGTRLLVFEDTTRAEIEFNLSVDELYWIMLDKKALGLPDTGQADANFRLPRIDNVEIEFEIDGIKLTWQGYLDGFASYGVNEQTRNVPCRVIVDNPHLELNRGLGSLRRGMFVRVKIPVEPSVPLIRFPEQALSADNRAWVVRNDRLEGFDVQVAGRISTDRLQQYDGSFVPESVKLHPSSSQIRSNDQWIVALNSEEGIRDGDRVVDSPLTLPYNGMEIIIHTDPNVSSTPTPPKPSAPPAPAS